MTSTAEIDLTAFRGALSSFATGVTIVTAHHDGVDVGLTASSFNSVSLNPPMVLWSLSKDAGSRPVFERSAHFAVHVLTDEQLDLSTRFAKWAEDKFVGLQLDRGDGQTPLLRNCSARFECRKAFEYDGGDHIIFVGEVIRFDHSPGTPLVFHGGRYATASPKIESAVQAEHLTAEGLAYWIAAAYFAWRAPGVALSQELDLTIAERRLLAALLENGNRTLGEINQEATAMDPPVQGDVVERLADRALISKTDFGRLALTSTGHKAIMSLIAARKAVEAAAALELGNDRTLALCRLLKDFVTATNAAEDPLLVRQMNRFKQLEGVLDNRP